MELGQTHKEGGQQSSQSDILHNTPSSLGKDFGARNTREAEVGSFLVLGFRRIYREAEMLILCCLHDNRGFYSVRKCGWDRKRGMRRI